MSDRVEVLPGGGWLIQYQNDGDECFVEPVVGWAIYHHRDPEGNSISGVPLVTDCHGDVMALSDTSDKYKVFHPDARVLPSETGKGTVI